MRGLKEFKFLFNKLPFYVILYPTSRCNARCPHCFNSQRQADSAESKELSLDEIGRISKNFGHVKVLTITGGEPFLRGDIAQIVKLFYENNGLQYVSFHTNGFLSDRVVTAVEQVLRESGGLEVIVCISIDAIGAEHDKFRGVPGGFDKVLDTINRLNDLKKICPRLSLITSTIFSASTRVSFKDTVEYIKKNVDGVKPTVSFVRGDTKEQSEKDVDFNAYREFHDAFSYKVDRRINPFSAMAFKEALEAMVNKVVVDNYRAKRQTVACCAGKKLVVIYENGEVCPCETSGYVFGNLREAGYDIAKLLHTRQSRFIFHKINKEKACHCTWENVIPVNIIFSLLYYPRLIKEWFKLFWMRRKA